MEEDGWVETNQSNICKYPYLTSVSMPSAQYHQAAKQTSMGQIWMLDGLVSTHWKRISGKQSARWQHLSREKASAVFTLQKKLLVA